jgi:hypothetical protein
MTTIQIKIPNWLDRICAWPAVWYRKKRYKDPFRRIPLGEGLFALVSPQDFYRLNNFRWCARGNNRRIYAVRFDNTCNKGKTISMHREIMNHPAGLLVDHKNSNTLDNRRANLRRATHSQNMHNRQKIKSKTSSKFIGVFFDKRIGKWAAKIRYQGKRIYLGSFKTEIEAARAYDEAAKKYHGDFARLNFPKHSEGPKEIPAWV